MQDQSNDEEVKEDGVTKVKHSSVVLSEDLASKEATIHLLSDQPEALKRENDIAVEMAQVRALSCVRVCVHCTCVWEVVRATSQTLTVSLRNLRATKSRSWLMQDKRAKLLLIKFSSLPLLTVIRTKV